MIAGGGWPRMACDFRHPDCPLLGGARIWDWFGWLASFRFRRRNRKQEFTCDFEVIEARSEPRRVGLGFVVVFQQRQDDVCGFAQAGEIDDVISLKLFL